MILNSFLFCLCMLVYHCMKQFFWSCASMTFLITFIASIRESLVDVAGGYKFLWCDKQINFTFLVNSGRSLPCIIGSQITIITIGID